MGRLSAETLTISAQDNAAITRIASSGERQLVLASGRLYAASRPFAVQLGLKGPIIALQGAAAYDLSTEQRLFCTPLAVPTALRAYDDLHRRGFHLQLYYGDALYLDTLNDAARYYLSISRVEPVMVPDLRALLTGKAPQNQDRSKCLGSEANGSRQRNDTNPRGGLRRFCERLPKHACHILEVTDPRATKGQAS